MCNAFFLEICYSGAHLRDDGSGHDLEAIAIIMSINGVDFGSESGVVEKIAQRERVEGEHKDEVRVDKVGVQQSAYLCDSVRHQLVRPLSQVAAQA